MSQCKHCKKFFNELGYRCAAETHGECDCPKCQGMCQCSNPKKYYAIELSVWGSSVYVFDSKAARSNWLQEDGDRIPILAKQLTNQDKHDIKDPEYMSDHFVSIWKVNHV